MDTGAQDAALGTLIEQLAAIEHERWASWQDYLHRICEPREDGALIIPTGFVDRWERQIATPYADLSEAERESDREQVRRYLPLIREALHAAEERFLPLVALAHELVELEHGARAEQLQALHRLGIVVTLDEHLARARAFSAQQHARIDALAGSPASGGVAGEEGQR